MANEPNHHSADPVKRRQQILDAACDAVRETVRRHMLLGESVVVADDDDTARIIGPEEIGRNLDQEAA